MPSKYTTDAYKDLIYKHPDWKSETKKYEQGFATNLAKSPVVKQAAHGVLSQMGTMLQAYYGTGGNQEEKDENVEELTSTATEMAGENPSNSGESTPSGEQYGDDVTIPGSIVSPDFALESDMDMLMQQMLMNGIDKKGRATKGQSFNDMLNNITADDQERMRAVLGNSADGMFANMNFDVLGNKKARKKNRNALTDASYSRMKKLLDKRKDKKWAEKYTPTELKAKRARFRKKDKPTAGAGAKKPKTNKNIVKMLTAYRMMGANKTDLLYFRLALMAWMVSSGDESIYSVMRSSHEAGVRGGEDMSEMAELYQTIDPLSKDDIRENYAPDKQYPHETIYLKLVEELSKKRKANRYDKNKKKAELAMKRDNIDLPASLNGSLTIEEQQDTLQKQKNGDRKQVKLLNKEIQEFEKLLDPTKEQIEQNERRKDKLIQLEAEIAAIDIIIGNISKQKLNMENDIKQYNYFYEKDKQKENDDYRIYTDTVTKNNDLSAGEDLFYSTKGMNAQDVGLNVYTTPAYYNMNTNEEKGNKEGKKTLESTGELYHGDDKSERDDAILKDVLNVIRLSGRISQDALLERGGKNVNENTPDHKRLLYRGEPYVGAFSQPTGSAYTVGKLTSTTSDSKVAKGFYDSRVQSGSKGVLASYEIDDVTGFDVMNVSAFKSEKEVLLPIGTEFIIEHEASAARYNRATGEIRYENEIEDKLDDPLWSEQVTLIRFKQVSKKDPRAAQKRSKRDAYRDKLLSRSRAMGR